MRPSGTRTTSTPVTFGGAPVGPCATTTSDVVEGLGRADRGEHKAGKSGMKFAHCGAYGVMTLWLGVSARAATTWALPATPRAISPQAPVVGEPAASSRAAQEHV